MDRSLNAGVRMVMVGWENGLGLCRHRAIGRERGKGKNCSGYGNGAIPYRVKILGVM